MATGKIINASQFVRVVSDKKLKKDGIRNGDIFMMAAFKDAPVEGNDPYLFRKWGVIIRHRDGILEIPDEDNDYQAYIVDLRNLESVSAEEQEQYEQMLRTQYGETGGSA